MKAGRSMAEQVLSPLFHLTELYFTFYLISSTLINFERSSEFKGHILSIKVLCIIVAVDYLLYHALQSCHRSAVSQVRGEGGSH